MLLIFQQMIKTTDMRMVSGSGGSLANLENRGIYSVTWKSQGIHGKNKAIF